MVGLVSILCAFITCVFPSLKNLVSVCTTLARQKLDTSRHNPFLSKFSQVFFIPLNRQPNPLSHISKLSVCSIEAQHHLNPSKQFGCRHHLDLSRFCSRHLLNTSRSNEMPDSIYIRGLTCFTSHPNISIPLSSLSIQTISFH